MVADPFLGSGAFGVAATRLELNRYFIDIEIDKDVLERARNNILNEISKNK